MFENTRAGNRLSNTLAHLQAQMQALGPATTWIEALIQDDSQSWSLHTTRGLDIGISFASPPARLILSAPLGKPEDADRQSVYATMLCTNLLYAEEASLRVALTGPEGDLMLISEISPVDWSIAELAAALLRFSGTVQSFIDALCLSTEEITEASEISEAAIAALRV